MFYIFFRIRYTTFLNLSTVLNAFFVCCDIFWWRKCHFLTACYVFLRFFIIKQPFERFLWPFEGETVEKNIGIVYNHIIQKDVIWFMNSILTLVVSWDITGWLFNMKVVDRLHFNLVNFIVYRIFALLSYLLFFFLMILHHGRGT